MHQTKEKHVAADRIEKFKVNMWKRFFSPLHDYKDSPASFSFTFCPCDFRFQFNVTQSDRLWFSWFYTADEIISDSGEPHQQSELVLILRTYDQQTEKKKKVSRNLNLWSLKTKPPSQVQVSVCAAGERRCSSHRQVKRSLWG